MKTFFRDLWNYYKGWFKFFKKHWFGTLLFESVLSAIAFSPIFVPVIEEKIKERKKKKN